MKLDYANIAKRLNSDPSLVAAQKRLSNAQEKLATAIGTRDELGARLTGATAGQKPVDELTKLLYTDEAIEPAVGPLEALYREACANVDTWEKVVRLGRQQLSDAQRDAAGKVAAELRPELVRTQKSLLAKTADTAIALDAYLEDVRRLTSLGLDVSLSVYCGVLRDGSVSNGPLFSWVMGEISAGRLSEADIPTSLAKKWSGRDE